MSKTEQNKAPKQESNLDFLNVDIEIEDRVYGSEYPICQWMNGDPRQKKGGGPAYTGGFFISADQQLERLPEGFEPFTLITRDNTEVEGFACRQLTIAPIRRRMCWQVRPEGGLSRRFGWNSYDAAKALGKPRGLVHVLVGVVGLSEPLVLSFGGLVGGQVTSGAGDRGILLRHSNKVVNAARRIARRQGTAKAFPNCMFSVTIGAARDPEGNPVFTTVGEGDATSTVTFPAWLDEPASVVTPDDLAARFVGKDRLAKYQDWFKAADAWVDAWDDTQLAAAFAQIGGATTEQAQLTDNGGAPF